MKTYFVYILASRKNGTLYIGVTNDLARRILEHRNGTFGGYTDTYRVHDLVHYESTNDVRAAIEREKQLKNWRRAWKLALIEKENPAWRDLLPFLDPASSSG